MSSRQCRQIFWGNKYANDGNALGEQEDRSDVDNSTARSRVKLRTLGNLTQEGWAVNETGAVVKPCGGVGWLPLAYSTRSGIRSGSTLRDSDRSRLTTHHRSERGVKRRNSQCSGVRDPQIQRSFITAPGMKRLHESLGTRSSVVGSRFAAPGSVFLVHRILRVDPALARPVP